MTVFLIFIGLVIVSCTLLGKLTGKMGVPVLVAFLALGMLFGVDGLGIDFENFDIAEQISTICLIFIMFYGGFGTNWKEGKKVAVKAGLLSSVGVVITAGLTAIFCYFVLKMESYEALLMGSVIASTDAATVFNILRSKKLGLRYGTSSLLELESGSNDPWSYMLTVIVLQIAETASAGGGATASEFVILIVSQLAFGVGIGAAISVGAKMLFQKVNVNGVGSMVMVAVALLAYAVPTAVGGNGYLAVYIVGIVLGNIQLHEKKELVNFFDGITGLLQIVLFFLLGFLATPVDMIPVVPAAAAVMLFLTFVARPIAVMLIMTPFKATWRQQAVIMISGFRGAASIAFAILIKLSGLMTDNDIFHITFVIVLLSIALQGSLLPVLAKKLKMIDEAENVLKTFSDYSTETELQFLSSVVVPGHAWIGKQIKKITFPPDIRVVMILRGEERIIPKGDTEINEGDKLIFIGTEFTGVGGVILNEVRIDKDDSENGKKIAEITLGDDRIVLIKRMSKKGMVSIVPNGQITIRENDILVMASI
ncbi:MAG: potassium/proton antiporter [Ruminococcus sp.]|nr:potassium/proton antiporter [Ruminococcus sp.]